MAIPAQRIIKPTTVRNFGRDLDAVEVPPLTDVQTKSYDRFLQLDAPANKRTPTGLEGVLQPREEAAAVVVDHVGLAVHEPRGADDPPAVSVADALMA